MDGAGAAEACIDRMVGRRSRQLCVSAAGFAIGVAAAKNNGKVALIEGDGSLIMHIQEFETLRRHGVRMLICVLNDGAYGAEVHKLRQDGLVVAVDVAWNASLWDFAAKHGVPSYTFKGAVGVGFF